MKATKIIAYIAPFSIGQKITVFNGDAKVDEEIARMHELPATLNALHREFPDAEIIIGGTKAFALKTKEQMMTKFNYLDTDIVIQS